MFPSKKRPYYGIFIYNRVKKLKEMGYDIHVYMPNPIIKHGQLFIKMSYKKSYFINNILVNIVNYFYLPKIQDGIKILSKKINKIITQNDFNIVHIHKALYEGYMGYLLKRQYNIPYIVTAHGSEIHHTSNIKKIYKEIVLKTLNNSFKSIFVSKYLFNQAEKLGYKNNNWEIVPNGVNSSLFKIINKNKIAEKLNLNGSLKYVGFIGRLDYIKGADLIPDIFYKIKQFYSDKDIKFILIGSGKLKNSIFKKLRYYGLDKEIIYKKEITYEKLPDWLNIFHVLLLPSRKEGFGCIGLESLACGTPIIVSSNYGLIEFVKSKNNNLHIIKYSDNESDFIRQFVKKSLFLLKSKYSENLIRQTTLHMTWENTVKQEIKLYNQYLKEINRS